MLIFQLGVVALTAIIVILPNHPPNSRSDVSQIKAWLNLDWIGTLLSVAVVTMLMLPLQWAGSSKAWNDPVIISLLVAVSFLFLKLIVVWLCLKCIIVCRSINPVCSLGEQTRRSGRSAVVILSQKEYMRGDFRSSELHLFELHLHWY